MPKIWCWSGTATAAWSSPVSPIAFPRRSTRWCISTQSCPRDGESCWHLVNDEERQWYLDVDDTGYGVPPMPFFDARASAHPLASFLQRITLTGDLGRFRRRDFVYALKWPGDSPLRPSYDRVSDDPSWTTHELDGAHNLMRDNPDDLLRILLDVSPDQ